MQRIIRSVLSAAGLSALWLATAQPVASASAQQDPPAPASSEYRFASETYVKVKVTPKDAAVYVDGYYTGRVDDFDGVFQRLYTLSGPHEVVVYKPGYRSLRERLYLSPLSTRTIRGELVPLGPGEPDPGPPVPEPAPAIPGDAPDAILELDRPRR